MEATLSRKACCVKDDPAVHAVVLRAAGERSFCAGLDLGGARQGSTGMSGASTSSTISIRDTPPTVLHNMDTPVICALNGGAAGYGMDLATGALVEEGMAAAIRIAHLPESSLVAVRVGETRRVLCATPAYLRRWGTPKTPAALADHRCILFTGLESDTVWSFAGETPSTVPVRPVLRTNQFDVALKAVLQGLGCGLFLCYQVAALLANTVDPETCVFVNIGSTADTLDESEKLDTVRHEHDDKGRTYVGYGISKAALNRWVAGVAGDLMLHNIAIIALAIDLTVAWVPAPQHLALRLLLVLLGIALVGAGSALYLTCGLGAGPRDGLMTAIHYASGISVARVRAALEGVVLALGWLLGGRVGVGTLLFALGIGGAVALWLTVVGHFTGNTRQ